MTNLRQISQRAGIGRERKHEIQAAQPFKLPLQIVDRVILLDLVSLQETIDLMSSLETEQTPQVGLIQAAMPVFFRDNGLHSAAR